MNIGPESDDRRAARPPAPAMPGWADRFWRFGGLVVLAFLFQAASGIYLAMFFQPNPEDAWASVEFIETSIWPGAFFRSLHRWGSCILALFLGLHLLHGIFHSAWRCGGMRWAAGILLLPLASAFVITGYLLPWDFRSYWTVKTIGNWLDHLPLFADSLRWLLFTDTPNGIVPVGRWFAIHTMALPLLAGICFCRCRFPVCGSGLIRQGREAASRMAGKKLPPAKTRPFPSGRRARAVLAVGGTVLLLFALAAFGIQKQDIADPVTTSPIPQPDWLFLLFFQVTRYFQDGWEMTGVFWIPALLLSGLFLPLVIDRGTAGKKWLKRLFFPFSMAVFLALLIVTCHTGSTTPPGSCASCHKKGFGRTFATAPKKIGDFSTRYDNKWLALHYRYPQYFWMMDVDVPGW